MNTLKPHSRFTRRIRAGGTGRLAVYLTGLALISLASWLLPITASTAAAPSRLSGFGFFSHMEGQENPTNLLTFNRWSTNGPAGSGAVSSLAVDPGNPAVVYAGTASGVFKSADNGGSWSRLGNGLTSTSIRALAIDALDTATVYAGTDGDGAFKSTDGGASWSAVRFERTHPFEFAFITALATAPGNPGIVYALDGYEVFRSTDGGANWSRSNVGAILGFASGMAVAPSSPNTVYVFNYGCDPTVGCFGSIAKSTDGGVSWSIVNSDGFNFGSFAIAPRDPNTLYGGDAGTVFKSTDGGVSWQSFPDGLPTDYSTNVVNSLAIDPRNPNVIYAATGGAGVFRSADGGAHWSPFNEGLTDLSVNVLAIDRSGRNLHAGTRTGVFDYRDATGCAYSISPAAQSFPATGASGSVNVSTESGCSWQASSAATWISITSGASGSGDGTVVFSVAPAPDTNPRTGTLTVAGQTFTVNQSGTLPPNLIDDTQFFVRQHYLDFLNREPDLAGLNFWVDNIESCASDAHCREVKRIDTSAAFFLSIEFQETGYFVYRMYKSAYGDATSPNVLGTVPIIRLEQFLPDQQRVGQGVVVNQGDWRTQLVSNKNAFAAEFVSRPEFTAAYPQTLTAAQFIDTLNNHAGGVLSQAERDRLVDDLSTNAITRAQALMSIAEDADLVRLEYNRAFVLMQFYGYLRRNPDDAPDLDFAGYNFWLTKLNQFNGNFRQAEMVKAFISSSEYRKRFGP